MPAANRAILFFEEIKDFAGFFARRLTFPF
jgi:hypothetical protein